MDTRSLIPSNQKRPWLAIAVILLSSLTLSCQIVQVQWTDLAQRPAYAAPVPTPGPTESLADLPGADSTSPTLPANSGAPANEGVEASKIIPIPAKPMPRGPRKQSPNRLVIPSVGIDTKVIELNTRYTDKGDLVWETAPFAAGHHVGTANPGEQGNVVISGHISSPKEGAVFSRLPDIKVGDGLVVVTEEKNFLYQVVDKVVVLPTQVNVMSSTAGETLTLLTCVPDGIYSHRLVVTARRTY